MLCFYRYTRANRPDRALEYSLRLKKPNVFLLIREYGLFSAVQEKALLLMEFDQYLYDLRKKERDEARAKAIKDTAVHAPKRDETLEPTVEEELSKGPAVQLLVEHTDEIPVCFFFFFLGRKKPCKLYVFVTDMYLFVCRSRKSCLNSGTILAYCTSTWMHSFYAIHTSVSSFTICKSNCTLFMPV